MVGRNFGTSIYLYYTLFTVPLLPTWFLRILEISYLSNVLTVSIFILNQKIDMRCIIIKMTSEYKPEIKELLSSREYSLKSGVFLVEGFSRCALSRY